MLDIDTSTRIEHFPRSFSLGYLTVGKDAWSCGELGNFDHHLDAELLAE